MIKIKKSNIIPLFLLSLIIISGLSLAFGYKSAFSAFEGEGTTFDGDGCHDSTAPESPTGNVEILSITGNSFDGGENFTISAKIINFSEAASQSVVFGFTGRGDNSEFNFNISNIDVDLDVDGDSSVFYFEVIGPNADGNFSLIADALWIDGDDIIQFTTGGLILEFSYVELPSNGDPDPNDNGNDLLDQALIIGYNIISILIYIFGIVMFISSNKKKKKNNRKQGFSKISK